MKSVVLEGFPPLHLPPIFPLAIVLIFYFSRHSSEPIGKSSARAFSSLGLVLSGGKLGNLPLPILASNLLSNLQETKHSQVVFFSHEETLLVRREVRGGCVVDGREKKLHSLFTNKNSFFRSKLLLLV